MQHGTATRTLFPPHCPFENCQLLAEFRQCPLGAVLLLIALASDSIWALAAGTARHWFGRSPKRISKLSAASGVMMIGLGGTLALAGNKF